MKNNITGNVSVEIDAPAEKVWEALTTPSIIKKYFFNTNAESDFEEGSPIRFTGEWEGKTYEDKGTIKKVEEKKLFKYSYWSSMSGIEDKPENYAVITYKLNEKNGKTILSITQENIPDEKMKEHSEENWNKVLENLKHLLERENIET
ncbi:MAG: hypothetical protein K0S32_164 [Bacteroidetes bacterium]|jgi:uncharacterized protein YndB with AHSA1/START domain|nr:hypothetical protein [Bacteroidota bacterium]